LINEQKILAMTREFLNAKHEISKSGLIDFAPCQQIIKIRKSGKKLKGAVNTKQESGVKR